MKREFKKRQRLTARTIKINRMKKKIKTRERFSSSFFLKGREEEGQENEREEMR